MPRADAYYYITHPRQLQHIRAATAGGQSLVAAAHGVVVARSAAPIPSDVPTPDEVDDYPWAKDDCMDVNGIRWAARWAGAVVVATRSPTVVGLWA